MSLSYKGTAIKIFFAASLLNDMENRKLVFYPFFYIEKLRKDGEPIP